jgi:hypothetical protein
MLSGWGYGARFPTLGVGEEERVMSESCGLPLPLGDAPLPNGDTPPPLGDSPLPFDDSPFPLGDSPVLPGDGESPREMSICTELVGDK